MSPSAMAKSPMSASGRLAGSTQVAGWAPSVSMRLAARMAAGAKRAPGRLVVPMSSGMPAMTSGAALSAFRMPRKLGWVAKVGVLIDVGSGAAGPIVQGEAGE